MLNNLDFLNICLIQSRQVLVWFLVYLDCWDVNKCLVFLSDVLDVNEKTELIQKQAMKSLH